MSPETERRCTLTVLRLSCLLLAVGTAHPADAEIVWDVSVKFVMGPDGEYPGSAGDPDCTQLWCSAVSCEDEVVERIEYGNAVLAALGSGFRMRLIEAIEVTLPPADFSCCEDGTRHGAGCDEADDCPGDPDNGIPDGTCEPVESFFMANNGGCTITAIMEGVDADTDNTVFQWNDNAINVYVNNACGGGVAPRAPRNPIVIGQSKVGAEVRWLHEIGHFFSLAHTHGSSSCPIDGDDCLDDTVPDHDDWDSAELIAQGNGYTGYDDSALMCEDRQDILDVLYNIMSYHQDIENYIACDPSQNDVSCFENPPPDLCRHRLTSNQLEVIADLSNTLRRNVSTGCAIFVDSTTINELLGVHACDAAVGFCASDPSVVCCDLNNDGLVDEPCAGPPPHPRPDLDGNSVRPYPTVAGTLGMASRGDTLFIRGGYYPEGLGIPLVIDKTVTLQSSRGWAVIGASSQ